MSSSDTGIAHKASELLHDLLVTAFHSSQQYRKGFKIEIRNSPLDDHWQLAMLDRPARGQVRVRVRVKVRVRARVN